MTSPTLTGTHLRTVLAHAPTSIVALSSLIDGQPDGMIAGSFVGISLDPPLVGVAIQDTSSTWPRLRSADAIGISVLTEEHAQLVRQLAGPKEHRFDRVGWFTDGEAVHLDQCCAQLTTQLVDEIPIGDHILAVMRVIDAAEFSTTRPLVFHGSQVTTIAPTSH